MMKKIISVMAAAALVTVMLSGCTDAAPAASAPAAPAEAAADDAAPAGEAASGTSYKIAVVPKMTNIAWFQRMEEGVNQYNEETGSDIFYGGSAEGADQASYVESLLAEDWDAICVVPFDSEAMMPIFEKARAQGIKVITHEAASMDSSVRDYDIEAFKNADYGANFMEELGALTGGKGKYIQFVGSLTSVSHMEWCDAAQKLQEEKFPDMECIGRFETADDTTSSYDQTKELLTANPDIVAIEGSASTDIVGAAQAVEEMGLAGKVSIVGTSMTSIAGQYVEDGTIASFSVWDPAEAGKAMIGLAIAALDGTVEDGMSLGASGYESITDVDGVFYGNARVDVTKDNMANYDF
ncbi:MAG: substrate-binding domain-containing protein [Lachnospiraceae bacterium]|nr:substrate-binding domain-containing protein [Lachnospiraceae bacterium]